MFFVYSSLGIDIGNHSVRVALLKKNKQGIRVCALVEENINHSHLHQVLIKITRQLRKLSGFPFFLPKHQIMAVTQSQVAIKRFDFASTLCQQEQYIHIGMQLAESLGLAYEELLYDYYTFAEQNTVEAYACRLSLVEEKLLALADSGYRLSVIELQTQSLMRLYYKKIVPFNNKIALLLDIDAQSVQFLFGDGKSPPFYRELAWSGEGDFILIDKREATKQLCEYILRQDQQICGQFPHLNVAQIWLCGQNADQIDSLELSAQLNKKVSFFDPLEGLKLASTIKNSQSKTFEKWTTAIGLAMRGVE